MTEWVVFCLRGHMLERFVGRAIQEGVRFERIERPEGRKMRLTVSQRDAGRLVLLAEEYRMDLTAESGRERPCRRRRVRERGTMALGLMLGLMIVTAFTSRIWRVEAVSLDGMASGALLEEIEQSAAAWGAEPGANRHSIDRDALALSIQAQRPELTHVNVRLNGVTLRVEVAVEAAEPEVYEVSARRDLIASRDAVIVYVEPLAGRACVQPGDAVRRGQVLIRGEERIDAGQTREIRALGKAIGRVWFTGSCELPLSEIRREKTGNVRVSTEIRLAGWSWPLSRAEDFECQETEEEILPIGGLFLPLSIVRTVRRETRERWAPLDEQAIRAQGAAWALELARAELPGTAEETDSWVDFTEKEGMLAVQAVIEARMDIAADPAEAAGDS